MIALRFTQQMPSSLWTLDFSALRPRMIKPPSQAPFAPLPSGLVDGTLLPQSRAAPLGLRLRRSLPRRFPAAWFTFPLSHISTFYFPRRAPNSLTAFSLKASPRPPHLGNTVMRLETGPKEDSSRTASTAQAFDSWPSQCLGTVVLRST